MLLMIDNYDSFTYNIVHYLEELGEVVEVVRNDAISLADIDALAPARIVISPGPGKPRDAGISPEVIRRFSGKIPILGVCLGHQCIAEVMGARVVAAGAVMHGKTSRVYHSGEGVFAGLDSPFEATRYHSLVVAPETLPAALAVTAWTRTAAGERGDIMGIRHRTLALEGVQFHPESIATRQGHALLANFLQRA